MSTGDYWFMQKDTTHLNAVTCKTYKTVIQGCLVNNQQPHYVYLNKDTPVNIQEYISASTDY